MSVPFAAHSFKSMSSIGLTSFPTRNFSTQCLLTIDSWLPKSVDCYSINRSRKKTPGSNKRNEVSVFFGCDMTCKLRISTTWRKFLVQVINSQTRWSCGCYSVPVGILLNSNASVNSKHQHPPPRATPFCTLLLPRGRDLYLTTFPGAGFLHIHKITFSTVKKYTFTQLAFGSYLHALHRQFRLQY